LPESEAIARAVAPLVSFSSLGAALRFDADQLLVAVRSPLRLYAKQPDFSAWIAEMSRAPERREILVEREGHQSVWLIAVYAVSTY